MAKSPRKPVVALPLCFRLTLPRGLDLTLAGTLTGVVHQHGCTGRIDFDGRQADVGNIIDMVGLGIEPNQTLTLTLRGVKRRVCADHLITISRGRWSCNLGE